jgi:hypothetical protein
MLVCTICAANHLPKAACLASSLIRTQGEHTSVLCLVERDRSSLRRLESRFNRVVLASETGIQNIDLFLFRHTVYEACCALKAHFLLWVMREFPQEHCVIFLDPDTLAYSRFEEVESLLPKSNTLVTPHHLQDDDTLQALWDNTIRTLICGTFNAGFLALRPSVQTLEFLKWWDRKTQLLCYADTSTGLYVDQKWLDLAFSFFDLTVLREPGYNVANWNISKRHLTKGPTAGDYLVDGKPLRFFHFSTIDDGRDMFYFKRYLNDDNPVFTMRQEYLHELAVIDIDGLSRTAWSYGQFCSGELITDHVRQLFRGGSAMNRIFPDPFAESNATLLSALARPAPPP